MNERLTPYVSKKVACSLFKVEASCAGTTMG